MGRFTVAFIALAFAAVIAAPGAQARDFNCDASAIRLQIASQATIEPITANRGETTCKEVKSQTSATSGPVSGGILLAQTTRPSDKEASALGGLGSLTVSASALANLPIPTLDAIDQIPAVPVPIPVA